MTEPTPPSRRLLGRQAALVCAALGGLFLLVAWPNPERDIRRAVIGALRDHLAPAMIDRALDEGDVEGGLLLADAADLAGIGLPRATADRLAAENTLWKQASRNTADCAMGAVTGMAAGLAGVACSVLADLTLVGDLRDATIELTKPLKGEEPDGLILGLATAGIALEMAAPATGGSSMAAKGGTSVLKVAAKSRMIARRLADEIGGILTSAVRPGPLRALSPGDLADAARLRRAMGEAVDLRRLAPLADAATSLGRISGKAGGDGAVMVARTARNLEDVKSAEKLASVFGKRTAGILKALGDRAFDLVELALAMVWALAGLIIGALCWLITAIISLRGLFRLIRRLLRRRAPAPGTP